MNKKIEKEKGQSFEILGFVVLAVAIIILTTILKSASTGGYATTVKELYETQEGEGFRTGVNAILEMTEEKTGKTMIELIGIASLIRNDTIYFGPTIGSINVSNEVKRRFDAIYGRNHWNVSIIFENLEREIQIIVVADSSGSLCDDVEELKNLPYIIDELRKENKSVSMRLFILQGQLTGCCKGTISCSDFKFTEYFDCQPIDSSHNCTLRASTDEDWGNGLACAIKIGPKGGWTNSIKVGIPLSDEIPGGSETCTRSSGSEQYISLQNGITAAKEIGMFVFPFKAATGKECCPSCNCVGDQSCGICYENEWRFTKIQCQCDETVDWYMSTIANETGGKVINLINSSEIVDKLVNITSEINITGINALDIGYPIPDKKNIRAVTLFIPTPDQRFVELRAYQWS